MRTILVLATMALLGNAVPAAAQDIVVTQVLQRLCIPVVTGRSWEDSTWVALEANARALNLTLGASTDDEYGRTWTYSLRQPSGLYSVAIRSTTGVVSCSIDAPDGVSRSQLEQAVTQVTGADWRVHFSERGPSWSRDIPASGGFIGKTQNLRIEGPEGNPQVSVSSLV